MRRADEDDRRATFVRLTSQGTQHFAAMAKAHETWVSEILPHFTVDETEALSSCWTTARPDRACT